MMLRSARAGQKASLHVAGRIDGGESGMAQRLEDSAARAESKKKQVLADLFERCLDRGDMVFSNPEVAEAAGRIGFGNPYDAVKVDQLSKLPDVMREADYTLLHLGGGEHMFVRGLSAGFHAFESIPNEERFPWRYRQSILNDVDSSESNILSVGMNQRILHDFLYDDIVASPKTYNARRTKKSVSYTFNGQSIQATNLQMELDMTCEYLNRVTVFEGKNGFPPDFAVYQLFHPWLYFTALCEEGQIAAESIDCCYLLRNIQDGLSTLRIYLYEFKSKDPASISLKKRAEYELIPR